MIRIYESISLANQSHTFQYNAGVSMENRPQIRRPLANSVSLPSFALKVG